MMAFAIALFDWIIIGLGVYFFCLSVSNALWLAKESRPADLTDGPLVSVLIPARDEEVHIEQCIQSFMNQTYTNYEVLVLNDNSTDKTGEILDSLQALYPDKLKVFQGVPLPPDWRGKPFAMDQLCKQAKGKYWLFTDADTIHSPRSISLAVTNIIYHKVDFLSGYITQKMKTFGEKITVPLMYLLSGFILPLQMCKWSKLSVFAVAIGQYICVKSDAFMECGGFSLVKGKTTEDVFMARTMRRHGYKTVFLNLRDAALCRMYTSWQSAVKGISKNIFDFIDKNHILLVFAVLGIFIFLTLPPFLAVGLTAYTLISTQTVSFTLVALWINLILVGGTWAVIFRTQDIDKKFICIYPLLFTNLLYTALLSWVHSVKKQGYEWKGRIVY
ncbi:MULTISPECIES: glycosyltransferase family 2 protein [unclassified Treponema]|uniref:glycosyltransferase n=1 Tax=unclassified Treponema TaxID=2638727 RepID=UPI0005301266|nr:MULTISPECIES: glycosyltransferase family 2 protein [unclassified Treponema]AIW89999.1 glycosyl transferase family 2 [Treponema sp. OMZ 838]UTC50020.1 glycosyltransferase [Treponema sp. OMZ 855]